MPLRSHEKVTRNNRRAGLFLRSLARPLRRSTGQATAHWSLWLNHTMASRAPSHTPTINLICNPPRRSSLASSQASQSSPVLFQTSQHATAAARLVRPRLSLNCARTSSISIFALQYGQ
ncbi:hypothetical protein GQ53DRAFT_354310 [Thozetella sp. PMI_491]|nr:hypothetical protein GQ53DRAFT_354310 [Thozetella sp. PMI_491]